MKQKRGMENAEDIVYDLQLDFATFRESNQVNQAGLLASLISGGLPIPVTGQWLYCAGNTSPVRRSRVTVARQPVIFTRFPFVRFTDLIQ